MKEKAAECKKNGKVGQALDTYNECLKLIDSSEDTIEYLALLLNRCACYLHMK